MRYSSERHQKRLDALFSKQQKLQMLDCLIEAHERSENPDYDYLRALRDRARRIRLQLQVLSTCEPLKL